MLEKKEFEEELEKFKKTKIRISQIDLLFGIVIILISYGIQIDSFMIQGVVLISGVSLVIYNLTELLYIKIYDNHLEDSFYQTTGKERTKPSLIKAALRQKKAAL